jgi:hypothetical protein
MLRSFMRDVLPVYEGKQELSDTPIGVATSPDATALKSGSGKP